MNIPTPDPRGPAPVAPFPAHRFRTSVPSGALAWGGMVAGLALLGTTLPANAAPRGAYRSGALHRAPAPPPPARFVPRFPGRPGRGGRGTLNGPYLNNPYLNNGGYHPNGGALNNGGYLNNVPSNGGRSYYNGGNGSSSDPSGGTDPGTGGADPGTGNGATEPGGVPGENGNYRSGAIPQINSRAPLSPPVKATGDGHSHLEAALQDLLAAERMMDASATPDVARVKIYLVTASQEVQSAGAKFAGKRHQAMVDIQNATNRLSQVPPSSQAMGLTGDAINNVLGCLQMNP